MTKNWNDIINTLNCYDANSDFKDIAEKYAYYHCISAFDLVEVNNNATTPTLSHIFPEAIAKEQHKRDMAKTKKIE